MELVPSRFQEPRSFSVCLSQDGSCSSGSAWAPCCSGTPACLVPASPGHREVPTRSHSGPSKNRPPEGPCETPAPWVLVPSSPARLL